MTPFSLSIFIFLVKKLRNICLYISSNEEVQCILNSLSRKKSAFLTSFWQGQSPFLWFCFWSLAFYLFPKDSFTLAIYKGSWEPPFSRANLHLLKIYCVLFLFAVAWLYLHTNSKLLVFCYYTNFTDQASLDNLWMAMETGRGSCGLEESKYHPHLEEGQEVESAVLEANQPHFNLRACDGASKPGNYFQTLLKTWRSLRVVSVDLWMGNNASPTY